jgi:hypothetical protein
METVPGALPPLLEQFTQWLEDQGYPALGSLRIRKAPVGAKWFPDEPQLGAKLSRCATAFGRLSDGSAIVVVERGEGLPTPVVLLDSEGDIRTLGTSPEEFLSLLAKADTGALDLDFDPAPARERLASWLKAKKVRVPKAPPFDLVGFLEGGPSDADALGPKPAPMLTGGGFDALLPDARRLAQLVGRRADDPEVLAYAAELLRKKVPATVSDTHDYDWVEGGKRHPVNLLLARFSTRRIREFRRARARSFPMYRPCIFMPATRSPFRSASASDSTTPPRRRCSGLRPYAAARAGAAGGDRSTRAAKSPSSWIGTRTCCRSRFASPIRAR